MSLIIAWLVTLACPGETAWIEYDHDADAFVGVCGDSDGQVLPEYRVQNHSHVLDVR